MKKIEHLLTYLSSLQEKAVDFYPLADNSKKLIPMFGEEKLKNLTLLGRNLADCLIVTWNKKGLHEWDNSPVVWIDSEGSPNAVFANDINEFMQLLYFDTGFIYDILSKLVNKNEFHTKTSTELDYYIEETSKLYPDYKKFIHFLNNDLKISKPTNPDLIIKNAYKKNDNFLKWMNQ